MPWRAWPNSKRRTLVECRVHPLMRAPARPPKNPSARMARLADKALRSESRLPKQGTLLSTIKFPHHLSPKPTLRLPLNTSIFQPPTVYNRLLGLQSPLDLPFYPLPACTYP
ncbi:hypothetical protein BT67DRAFT_440623 [Trichocladium antarcticum]|uniref:Uncharacterized protein n=1 Tax=Trichocladium antarcticum TaxID=1450529 RepID=A0AAN6ZE50_9PEZI|nr:hypothetical protein BT67DRAFT_440623 [Trichocladium antarcticum]